MPSLTPAEENDLAKLGIQAALAGVVGEQREGLSVVVPIFPSVVDHDFGAFNKCLQKRDVHVHLYINSVGVE